MSGTFPKSKVAAVGFFVQSSLLAFLLSRSDQVSTLFEIFMLFLFLAFHAGFVLREIYFNISIIWKAEAGGMLLVKKIESILVSARREENVARKELLSMCLER